MWWPFRHPCHEMSWSNKASSTVTPLEWIPRSRVMATTEHEPWPSVKAPSRRCSILAQRAIG